MSHKIYEGIYLPERFVSRPRPEQMAAHIIEVYSLKNFSWRSYQEHYLVPRGKLQKIFSIDSGITLPEIAEKLNIEEQHQSRKRPEAEESRQGKKKFRLPKPLRNLEQYIISEFEIRDDEVRYYFEIRKNAITLENPLEFHITEYLASNKEIIAISTEKVKVLAHKWKDTTAPFGDVELLYVTEAFDFNLNQEENGEFQLKN